MQFLSVLDVLPFENCAAVEYGEICARLWKKGSPIGTVDRLIAAHVCTEEIVLVTNKTREFERVEDLEIQNWV